MKQVVNSELLLSRMPDRAIKELEAHYREAIKIDSIRLSDYISISISGYYINGGNHQLAVPYLEELIQRTNKNRNEYTTAAAQDNLAICYFRNGENLKAIDLRKKSLKFYQEADSAWHQGISHLWLGHIYKQAGDYNSAMREYLACDSIAEILQRPDMEMWSTGSLATLMRATGDAESAVKTLNDVTELALELGDSISFVMSLLNTGNCYGTLKEYDNSLKYLDSAYRVGKELKDTNTMMGAQIGVISSLLSLKRFQAAQNRIDEARQIAESIDNALFIAHIQIHESALLANRGQLDSAYQFLISSISNVQELGAKELLYEYYKELAALCFAKGEMEEGRKHLESYDSLKSEIMLADEKSIISVLNIQQRVDELKEHSHSLTTKIQSEEREKIRAKYLTVFVVFILIVVMIVFVKYRKRRDIEKHRLISEQSFLKEDKRKLEIEKIKSQKLLESISSELAKSNSNNNILVQKTLEVKKWLAINGYIYFSDNSHFEELPKLIEQLEPSLNLRLTKTDVDTIHSLISDPYLGREERAKTLCISESTLKDRIKKLLSLFGVAKATQIPLKLAQLLMEQKIKEQNNHISD